MPVITYIAERWHLKLPIVVFLLVCPFIVVLAIFYMDICLTTVRGFFVIGFIFYGSSTLLVYSFIEEESPVIDYAKQYIIAAVMWWFYSLIANTKVAHLCNVVWSTILGTLALIKDGIASFISLGYFKLHGEYNEYAVNQFIEGIYLFILIPILTINLIALMLCEIKNYWIEKYNNGKDIEYKAKHDKTASSEDKNSKQKALDKSSALLYNPSRK